MGQTTDGASSGPAGGPRREPLPYAQPRRQATRHSVRGAAATVLGCAGWLYAAGFGLLTPSVRARGARALTEEAVGVVPLLCLTLVTAAGLYLAFGALVQRGRRRTFVTIGLALNLGLGAFLAGCYLLYIK